MATVTTGIIWVCQDCYLTHHGYDEHELGYEPETEPWALWKDERVEFASGGNPCECDDKHETRMSHFGTALWCETEQNAYCNWECHCYEYVDRQDFSWTPCEGCGSTLGGAREAMTYFIEEN